MSSSAAPSVSGIPGQNGRCGYQNGNAPCFTIQGTMLCCSENGYCGSDESYCLESQGCQYGCLPECAFAQPPCSVSVSRLSFSTNSTTSAISSPASSASPLSTASNASTNTAHSSSSKHKSGLSGGAIAGIVIGAIIGFIIILWLVAMIFSRKRRRNDNVTVAPEKEDSPVATPQPPPPPVGPSLRQTANPFDRERDYGEIRE